MSELNMISRFHDYEKINGVVNFLIDIGSKNANEDGWLFVSYDEICLRCRPIVHKAWLIENTIYLVKELNSRDMIFGEATVSYENKVPYGFNLRFNTETKVVVKDGSGNIVKTFHQLADSGERTEFSTGAQRDMSEGKGRMDLLPMCVLIRLSKHYEAGARKYDERNWEKGVPAHSFADSALRHFAKYMDGQTDEDHLIAAIWNLCGLAWTEEKKPEMMDIPARMTVE